MQQRQINLDGALLLLVDVQQDYLARDGVFPAQKILLARWQKLLNVFRSQGLPVVHVRTAVEPDGANAMPHWHNPDKPMPCCIGTEGVLPPPELAALPEETVFYKQFFSAFDASGLAADLRHKNVKKLVIAGLYGHACIRATVLDAYANGYSVLVVGDATGTTEILHDEITRAYLRSRACQYVQLADLLPSAGRVFDHYFPHTGRLAYSLPMADEVAVRRAVNVALTARDRWFAESAAQRADTLEQWLAKIRAHQGQFLAWLGTDVGKSAVDAEEELDRAYAHLQAAIHLTALLSERINEGVEVVHRPLGVVGLLTPWNNPVAIAIGKLAPAVACGNTVVWKPAPECARLSALLLQLWTEVCPVEGVINLVQGDHETGTILLRQSALSAFSLTGSTQTGRLAEAICQHQGQRLQAEMGANNGYVVWRGADLKQAAKDLVRAAFSYAGQRCTAIRRLMVDREIFDEFSGYLLSEVGAVVDGIGHPDSFYAPLLSQARWQSMADVVQHAVQQGATLLCGGGRLAWAGGNSDDGGYGFAPTVLQVDSEMEVFIKESFGPVLLMLPVDSFDTALSLLNAVPQGLIAGLCGGTSEQQNEFLRCADAGMLRLGSRPVLHSSAPFATRKASGIGVPERGRWDLDFYTQPQVIYTNQS